jgi:hypothetical protein
MPNFFYSDRKVFIGLARAARKAWKLMVSMVMTYAITQARIKIHQLSCTR